ncbi:MAG: recombinase family protein, partial [Actinobacteria bacterium]|nr:recombinase family protein [Actinomycetota bacterium]
YKASTAPPYIRVSPDAQAREGHSIPAQRERLVAFCKAQGWEVADFYVDDGFSGASLDRPELKRLRADVKAKKADLVLVWKVDRLSRKVAHLTALMDEFDQAGVSFRSATEPFDTGHAAGRAFLHMLSTFAELERETIRERSKMGIRQRVKEGHVHGRPTPFGYRRKAKGVWVVEPDEAEVVRLIYRRYREGAGVVRIAQELAGMTGNPVPATRNPGRHYDRQTSLHDRVRWILRNPVYAGYAPLNGELYSGRHPAIVPPAEWHEVQRIRESERAIPNRAKRSVYPLSGLIECAECGRNMTGFKQPNRAKDEQALARRPYYDYY